MMLKANVVTMIWSYLVAMTHQADQFVAPQLPHVPVPIYKETRMGNVFQTPGKFMLDVNTGYTNAIFRSEMVQQLVGLHVQTDCQQIDVLTNGGQAFGAWFGHVETDSYQSNFFNFKNSNGCTLTVSWVYMNYHVLTKRIQIGQDWFQCLARCQLTQTSMIELPFQFGPDVWFYPVANNLIGGDKCSLPISPGYTLTDNGYILPRPSGLPECTLDCSILNWVYRTYDVEFPDYYDPYNLIPLVKYIEANIRSGILQFADLGPLYLVNTLSNKHISYVGENLYMFLGQSYVKDMTEFPDYFNRYSTASFGGRRNVGCPGYDNYTNGYYVDSFMSPVQVQTGSCHDQKILLSQLVIPKPIMLIGEYIPECYTTTTTQVPPTKPMILNQTKPVATTSTTQPKPTTTTTKARTTIPTSTTTTTTTTTTQRPKVIGLPKTINEILPQPVLSFSNDPKTPFYDDIPGLVASGVISAVVGTLAGSLLGSVIAIGLEAYKKTNNGYWGFRSS